MAETSNMASSWVAARELIESAQLAYASGNRAKARRLAEQALGIDRFLDEAWGWIAQVAIDESRPVDGIVAGLEAVRLAPGRSTHRRMLAKALDRLGARRSAANNLREAERLDGGRPSEARSRWQTGLLDCHDPRLVAGVTGALGRAHQLREQGHVAQAAQILADADRWAPHLPELQFRLGLALYALGREGDALRHFERAALLDDRQRPAMIIAASLLGSMGLAERARLHLRQALELQVDDAARLSRALCVEAIEASVGSIEITRERMGTELDALLDQPLHVEAPEDVVQAPTFFLAYHGLPNRALLTKVAAVLQHATPSLTWTAPHCLRRVESRDRIRVGFISKFLRRHSIGKTSKGLIAQLSRERFEIISLFIPPYVDDDIARHIRGVSDRWITLPDKLHAARQVIADLELDILFFQDIGMESMSTYLAHARLAPIQCVSFGHPDTTGIPNMDYFISSDLYEPPGAQAHYSERLVLLRNLPTLAYYYRPEIAGARKERQDLGLDPAAHIYICPQTLFKIHPEFDGILADILRRDPLGRLILVNRHHAEWTHALCERWSLSMADVMSRIDVLPGHPGSDYLQMLAAADVMLDPLHFNGMNTSLEAFAVGTPVVTWPRDLQRGRHTAGMYRRMELPELIAHDHESYVQLAVDLGSNRERRAACSARILERCPVLYEDPKAVSEFERFFVQAWQAKLDGEELRSA